MNIGTRYKWKQCLKGWHPQDRKNTRLEIYLVLDENGVVKQYLHIWMNVCSTCLVSISTLGWFKIFCRWMNSKPVLYGYVPGWMDRWMNIGTRYELKQCLTGWHPQDRKKNMVGNLPGIGWKRYCKTTSTDMDEYIHSKHWVSISRLGRFKIIYRWISLKNMEWNGWMNIL
jgi:hypothetical protein